MLTKEMFTEKESPAVGDPVLLIQYEIYSDGYAGHWFSEEKVSIELVAGIYSDGIWIKDRKRRKRIDLKDWCCSIRTLPPLVLEMLRANASVR